MNPYVDSILGVGMALIVAFQNISELAEVSDYRVQVFINKHLLFQTDLKGHKRADGWEALVKKFAEDLARVAQGTE